MAQPESPYLAFIVGLHVATALALLIYFWRDWIRIIGGFFSSIVHFRVRTRDERLARMIVLATIPVGPMGGWPRSAPAHRWPRSGRPNRSAAP